MPPGSSSSFVLPSATQSTGPRMKKLVASKSTPNPSKKVRPKVGFGPRPPRLVAPKPTTPTPISAPRPRGTSGSSEEIPFPDFVRNQFMDVYRAMQRQIKPINDNQSLIKKQQKELDELKKKEVDHDQQIKGLTFQLKRQALHLGVLNKRDVAYTDRHKTLTVATYQIRRIVTELVELFAAQGGNTPLQVQAKCKLDELKKIQDDLDKEKDPNAAQKREQPCSSQAAEAATEAAVEGESGSGASGRRGK
ncbi:hypothetical protein Hdeb2414_s0008g00285421 [Helianthus debilis subsp. tardiflorus]